ncbi:hypothetical protein [Paenibacillus sp. 1781tsa1]|uniref:hypothetical protein n=1 Tax=Paenibacillus sp. 1781tsa1 TaxID=2953810 RepID=UPI00209EA511|nr:hypothetical protein [Paenibacillus sp. 1781tsa1]MCP1185113.1 hypothetical protein [Paenibacillus sp. 1781tsa1]
MPDLNTYLQYNDPLTIISRNGTPQDPFVDRADSLPVINGLITLLELPSPTDKVNIAGFVEVDQEVFENRRVLNEHEFLVHYGMGTIQFHSSQEGKAHLCRYKGRGLIMYPASRIYAMVKRNPDVVITLQDYIDQIQTKIDENQIALGLIEDAIKESQAQTDLSKVSTDKANQAADNATIAANKARDAYETTRLVYKEPVADIAELRTKYPLPQIGWTVQTHKDGKRYRFDGNDWILFDLIASNLQTVNEFKDGLMSVSEHMKLKDMPLELQDRVIVLCKQENVFSEIIKTPAPFPFNGEIIEIKGLCGVYGETETSIDIEKSRDMVNWTSILNDKLHFRANQHFDDRTVTIKTKTVNAGDLYRLNILNAGLDLQDLTIAITIRT